jgi:hypothetical protein
MTGCGRRDSKRDQAVVAAVFSSIADQILQALGDSPEISHHRRKVGIGMNVKPDSGAAQ